jgi:hypothetical protein
MQGIKASAMKEDTMEQINILRSGSQPSGEGSAVGGNFNDLAQVGDWQRF